VLAGGCLEAIDGIDVWIGQEHAEAVERRPHGMLCQLHQPELELLFALDDKLFTPSSYEQSRMRRESSPESERSRSLGCHVPMAFLGGGLTGLGTGSLRSCVDTHSSLRRSYSHRNSLKRRLTEALGG